MKQIAEAVGFLRRDHQLKQMNHLHCHTFSRDEDFIHTIRRGGPDARRAISCLYLKYRKRTYTYMYTLISKNAAYKGGAEDLVQDSFIIMIDKIRKEKVQVKSLAGYWIGISKMLFLNQLKKDKRVIYMNDMEEPYGYDQLTPETILFDKEEDERLSHAFNRLGPRCREVLMLWLDQYSMAEIAEKMNLSTPAMARKIKFDCFKKLKAFISSNYTTSSKNIR